MIQWGWRPLFIGWRPALILKGLGFLPVKKLIPLLIPQANPWSFLRRINDLEVLDSLEKSVLWLVEDLPGIDLWNSEFYSESEFYRPLFFPLFSLVSWALRAILGSNWRYGCLPQGCFEWAALICPDSALFRPELENPNSAGTCIRRLLRGFSRSMLDCSSRFHLGITLDIQANNLRVLSLARFGLHLVQFGDLIGRPFLSR